MGRPAILKVEVIGDASKANRELDGFGSKVGRLGPAVAAAGAAAAAGVAVLAVSAVSSASRVQQAFGGVESVFGATADQVKTLAREAASTVGLASSEYAELANVLGSQLKNLGVSSDALVPTTDRLIKQGADLAATFGGSTADAVAAVSSLLKGERDPIERYGVSIKAADVQARLAAQGLDKLTGAARTQAEQQATLALLSEQTAAANGAFARETGTLAGQQQRLSAMWENGKAALGERLLPVLTAAAQFITERAVPAVQRFWRENDGLRNGLAAVAGFITGRVVPAAQQFVAWFVDRIVPGLQRYVAPILAGIRSAFGSLNDSIERNRPTLDRMLGAARGLAEFLANRVAPVLGTVVGGAFRTLGAVLGQSIDTFSAVYRAVDRVVGIVGRLIDRLRDNALVSGIGKVAGLLGGHGGPVTAEMLQRNRMPGGLTAAGSSSGGGVGFTLGSLSLQTGDVTVILDGEPVRAVVRREVRQWERQAARRASGRVVTL